MQHSRSDEITREPHYKIQMRRLSELQERKRSYLSGEKDEMSSRGSHQNSISFEVHVLVLVQR